MKKASEHKAPLKNRVLIPLFFGLPGLGKTTFWEQLKKIEETSDIKLEYISEDKIWQQLMKE